MNLIAGAFKLWFLFVGVGTTLILLWVFVF